MKNAAWHPLQPDLLLIPCAIPETAVHLWKATWEAPRIVQSSLNSTGGRLEASWLRNTSDDVFNLMLSSTHEYLTALLQENGEILPNPFRAEGVQSVGVGAEILFDEGNSLDLSPIKISHEMMGVDESWPNENDHSRSSFGFGEGVLDDTFQYHKHAKLAS